MAGSFDIFRRYQRSLLVAVAILAMLAFFVLPPFLQMGGGTAAGDPVAARWTGGEIREGQLERSVALRSVVNRFLVEAAVAAGRDPARLPLFPESEEAVVRTILVNEEARRNGLVVSDTAINDFLAQWTNNLVRPEQLAAIIASLRLGPAAVSQHDLFEALRAELTGRNMLFMFQTGFSGDPPGWRWDYYRRLEQQATVEVVPVPVETVVAEVPAPTEAELRTFFDRHRESLPDPRSDAPGFRRPRRVRYEAFVARRDACEAAAAKEVTDDAIAAFYEKNKATMFRATPETKSADKDAQGGDKDAKDKPDGNDKPDGKPDEKGQQDAAGGTAPDVEPLEKVRDRIREQLAREKAAARIDAVFSAIAGDVGRYAEDLALWKARGAGSEPPPAPDVDLIASKQSLEAVRSDLVTAEQAVAAGGIGRSFELVADPGSRFGIRQQTWLDSIFGQNTLPLRPVTSRDVEGNRYLSWKTDDQAESVPTFTEARDEVEFSWRIVEGRGVARRKAEEIASRARAEKRPLAEVVGEAGPLRAVKAGPFTWLSPGASGQPELTEPEELEMPGAGFMEAVFALEPGETAVAFNEPRTVCYAIRLDALDPPEAALRDTFLAARSDPRRVAAVAQGEFSRSFGAWLGGLEKRYALTWGRQPRR
ncbi:MAG: hypothetical protein EBZ74_02690 [Planctomycetia bacterium]|nr:hypothetical protein [Planctomycetia bacterium]